MVGSVDVIAANLRHLVGARLVEGLEWVVAASEGEQDAGQTDRPSSRAGHTMDPQCAA